MLTDDEKHILADWHRHPGAAIARREIIERRKRDEAALGRALFEDPSSYDPIKVAVASGEYRQQLRELNLGAFAHKELERKDVK